MHLSVKRGAGDFWDISLIYGSLQRGSRGALWEDLKRIHNLVSGPWCAIGDFNVFLIRMRRKVALLTSMALAEIFRIALWSVV